MTRSTTGVVPLAGLMTVLFFVFLLSTAFVEDQKKVTKKEKPSAGVSAMKAGKNDDGSLRPTTPAEENKLNAELKKTLAKYPKQNAIKKADGSVSLVVAPHSLNAAVAHRGPDGKLHLNCSDDGTHATTKQIQENLQEE